MPKFIKYTAEEKYKILKAYEDGIGSTRGIATMFKINRTTLKKWRCRYEKYGIDGLKELKIRKKYSKELKEQALTDYLSGEYSLREVATKYEISDKNVLAKWINKYNSHREITATLKGLSQSMTKGRTTSLKERIEIVTYCIAHNKDYQHVAEVYQVSYQQVYQWVKKYESGGEDALNDKRGRNKTDEELTPEDKVNLAIRKLEIENERLRAENAFLKKSKELERGRF